MFTQTRVWPCRWTLRDDRRLCGGVDEPEDVVEDKVASGTVREELEGLGVGHGSLFLVDLFVYVSASRVLNLLSMESSQHTRRRPETRTRIPPASLEG